MKSEPRRVALDACAWLAIIHGEPTAELIRPLLSQINSGAIRPVGSTLLLTEIYKPSTNETVQQKQNTILQMLQSRDFDLVDVSTPIAREAAQLRLTYGFKTADSIHLATAKLARADWFVTMDRELQRKRPQLVGTTVLGVHEGSQPADLPWNVPTQEPLIDIPLHTNVTPLP